MLPFSFPFPFGCGSADVLWGGVFVLDFDLGVKDFANVVFRDFPRKVFRLSGRGRDSR